MKTILCWLIANIESQFVIIFLYFALVIQPDTLKINFTPEIINYFITPIIIAFIFAILTAVFTYQNFDEVISRQFKWRNSNVGQFEAQLKYTFSRFFVSLLVYGTYFILFTIQLLK